MRKLLLFYPQQQLFFPIQRENKIIIKKTRSRELGCFISERALGSCWPVVGASAFSESKLAGLWTTRTQSALISVILEASEGRRRSLNRCQVPRRQRDGACCCCRFIPGDRLTGWNPLQPPETPPTLMF